MPTRSFISTPGLKPPHRAPLWLSAGLFLAMGCEETPDTQNPNPTCPTVFPEATITCDEADCQATQGLKTYGTAQLSQDQASSWLVLSWVSSDIVDTGTVDLDYTLDVPGALVVDRTGPPRLRRPLQDRIPKTLYENLFGAKALSRIRNERTVRSWKNVRATRFIGTKQESLNDAQAPRRTQGIASGPSCTHDPSVCSQAALCFHGTCRETLDLKLRQNASTVLNFSGSVLKRGTYGAIIVDIQDTVSEADADELLKRFDERIAPLDHMFFGEPKDSADQDRDGNGVTIILFTSREVFDDNGDPMDLVGFFQDCDLRVPSDACGAAESNEAEILYMRPPSASITLDSISGTLAHEYEHLLNRYAKVIRQGSESEAIWLDEGLAGFAEDVLGYGQDAFKNIAAYLQVVSQISLTGSDVAGEFENDSPPRRGMAHLLVRYLFEQGGGATYGQGASELTDDGGIQAIRALVDNPDTGTEVFSQDRTGRSLHRWLGDLLTAVAIDGANYKNVSCNPALTFQAPAVDAYTGLPRGIDLRRSMIEGSSPLAGPSLDQSFETEEGVPVPINGGEIRTLDVTGATRISVRGPVDAHDVGLRAIPISP